MSRNKLKALIADVIDKSGKAKDTGFKQASRHITDTLIEFKSFDDILAHWYEHQARDTDGIGTVKGARIRKERWPFFIRQRYKAFEIYRKEMKRGLARLAYVETMWDKRNEFVFRYYSWKDPSPGGGAKGIKDDIDRPAMEAVATYVENVWRKREQKYIKANPGAVGYVERGGAIGTPGARRHPGEPLKNLATGFAHGLHTDVGFVGEEKGFNKFKSVEGGGRGEVGSTTGSVAVLENILSGELKSAFGGSSPIVQEFTEDIMDMFITEGNIQIGDFSVDGEEHKNVIRIWGHVSSSRDNVNKMRRWDRHGDAGIMGRVQEVLDKSMERLMKEAADKGQLGIWKIIEIMASPSIGTQIKIKGERKILTELKKKVPTMKVTFADPKPKKQPKKSAVSKSKGKKKGKPSRRRTSAAKYPRAVKGKTNPKSRTTSRGGMNATSPIGLVALLNRSLPAQVAKNMAPIRGSFPRRLTWRTGRFAGSAEITNIVPFPRSVEIQYTYQQDPYAVFESGSGDPRATGPARDPREIIGETVRQLAQSIMGTKYGLVRTKRV